MFIRHIYILVFYCFFLFTQSSFKPLNVRCHSGFFFFFFAISRLLTGSVNKCHINFFCLSFFSRTPNRFLNPKSIKSFCLIRRRVLHFSPLSQKSSLLPVCRYRCRMWASSQQTSVLPSWAFSQMISRCLSTWINFKSNLFPPPQDLLYIIYLFA